MALYVIGDTHFSSDGSYAMDVFGGKWNNYVQKIKDSLSVLKNDDMLILCGDFSWGMSLNQALPDFKLLDSFCGKKILLKGNHDYWWETVKKMKNFLTENGITSIDFLHNNFFEYDDLLICGTRGWMYDKNDPETQSAKVFKREVLRLEYSLTAARAFSDDKELAVFLHYPPVFGADEADAITCVLKKFGVKRCFYGHLHAESIRLAFNGIKDGVDYRLVSADAIDFKPHIIL